MKQKCLLCKNEWYSRIEKPKECPRCKRYDWNTIKPVKALKTIEETTYGGDDY